MRYFSFIPCPPCSRNSLRLCAFAFENPPLQIPTKVGATPIFLPSYETDLERTCSEGETVLEYRQEKGVNVKNQKFLR